MRDTGYFSPLLKTIITGPGYYLTRAGEVVLITSVDSGSDPHFPCVGTYSAGGMDNWNKTGRLYFMKESPNDIVSPKTG